GRTSFSKNSVSAADGAAAPTLGSASSLTKKRKSARQPLNVFPDRKVSLLRSCSAKEELKQLNVHSNGGKSHRQATGSGEAHTRCSHFGEDARGDRTGTTRSSLPLSLDFDSSGDIC